MKHSTYGRKRQWHLFYLILCSSCFLLVMYGYYALNNESTTERAASATSHEFALAKTTHHLPVLVIDTKGQEIEGNTEKKVAQVNDFSWELNQVSPQYTVDLKLYEPDLLGKTDISAGAVPTLDTKLVMNVRGQSSLVYDKKQYNLRLVDQEGQENPQELLGMAAHDKWVLNGMYSDKSLIRNTLAYQMGRQTMTYSPDTRYVEVYLNNSNQPLDPAAHYAGIYLLTEKIERGENRVNIGSSKNRSEEVSFIISRDKIKIGDPILRSDWSHLEEDFILDEANALQMNTVMTTTYPSKENLTAEAKQKIIDSLNQFEYALHSSHFEDRREGYQKYIDVDSFIHYALIQEITKNIDGGEVSTYFYKDAGGLLTAGPLWDFDQSMGNTGVVEVNEPTGLRIVNVIWFERLFQDEAFVKRYLKTYETYRNTIWSDENIDALIDQMVLELAPSVEQNQSKWYPTETKASWLAEIEEVRSFLKERLAWLDMNQSIFQRLKENPIK